MKHVCFPFIVVLCSASRHSLHLLPFKWCTHPHHPKLIELGQIYQCIVWWETKLPHLALTETKVLQGLALHKQRQGVNSLHTTPLHWWTIPIDGRLISISNHIFHQRIRLQRVHTWSPHETNLDVLQYCIKDPSRSKTRISLLKNHVSHWNVAHHRPPLLPRQRWKEGNRVIPRSRYAHLHKSMLFEMVNRTATSD